MPQIPEALIPEQHWAMLKFLNNHRKTMHTVSYPEYELSAIVHYLLCRIDELEREIIDLKTNELIRKMK